MPYAKAACLPESGLQFSTDTTVFTVSGWGVMEERNKYNHTHLSETLKHATVPYYDPVVCNEAYKDELNLTETVVTDNMICAGYADGGIDSCAGDSGGESNIDKSVSAKSIIMTCINQDL